MLLNLNKKKGAVEQGYYATCERLAIFEYVLSRCKEGATLSEITREAFGLDGDVTKTSEYMNIRRCHAMLVRDKLLSETQCKQTRRAKKAEKGDYYGLV